MLSLIVAMDQNRLIGNNNALPWHLSADLKRFKAITMGNPIIMGRKTYESIGKPLPGRQNIIITRDTAYQAEGCDVVHGLKAAAGCVGDVDEAFVIGGMQIYQQALLRVQRMYLTIIEHVFTGDAWFPEFNASDWQEVATESHQHADETQTYVYRFVTLERIRSKGTAD